MDKSVQEKVECAQQFVRDHPTEEWSEARVLAYDVEYLAERLRIAEEATDER